MATLGVRIQIRVIGLQNRQTMTWQLRFLKQLDHVPNYNFELCKHRSLEQITHIYEILMNGLEKL